MRRALLVTTDASLSDAIGSLAAECGFLLSVTSHSNSLNKIRAWSPHAVLLDIHSSSDLKLCGEIREVAFFMPVIIIAAEESEKNAVDAFRSGAWDYYRRPLDHEEIRTAVISALKKEHELTRDIYLHNVWHRKQGNGTAGILLRCPFQLRRVLTYLESNIDRQISLEHMATIADMSKYHFCRIFKQFLRTSPICYLHRLRIDASKEILMSEADISVTEVALRVGYNSPSQYGRMFRKFTGISPSQYRNVKLISEMEEEMV